MEVEGKSFFRFLSRERHGDESGTAEKYSEDDLSLQLVHAHFFLFAELIQSLLEIEPASIHLIHLQCPGFMEQKNTHRAHSFGII
ncbi:uncharacterized [Tachysurus ichikawai]